VICEGAWHGPCYCQFDNDPFPVLQATDLDESFLGEEGLEEDDPNWFKCGRDGYHLMCPFQCDLCHFRNIQGRRPGAKVQDNVLLMCIRRANLDAFWSRETATVDANHREGARVRSGSKRLGLDIIYRSENLFR
jgi:hypothetical protein